MGASPHAIIFGVIAATAICRFVVACPHVVLTKKQTANLWTSRPIRLADDFAYHLLCHEVTSSMKKEVVLPGEGIEESRRRSFCTGEGARCGSLPTILNFHEQWKAE